MNDLKDHRFIDGKPAAVMLMAEGATVMVCYHLSQAVREVVGWVVPVLSGVWLVAVAMLMRNSIVAYQRQAVVGWVI
jgi:methylenetetrahydrofolate dehydrogenase (NADP+)/methenyltetrahydrofolate cyclohydrolase